MITSVVYLEIPDDGTFDIKVHVSHDKNPLVDLLKKVEFRSKKTLLIFLERNKGEIIRSIPDSEEEILNTLEKQGFLDYLNIKWYREYTLDYSPIQPKEILDLAIKYNAVSLREVEIYLLEDDNNYFYQLHKAFSE